MSSSALYLCSFWVTHSTANETCRILGILWEHACASTRTHTHTRTHMGARRHTQNNTITTSITTSNNNNTHTTPTDIPHTPSTHCSPRTLPQNVLVYAAGPQRFLTGGCSAQDLHWKIGPLPQQSEITRHRQRGQGYSAEGRGRLNGRTPAPPIGCALGLTVLRKAQTTRWMLLREDPVAMTATYVGPGRHSVARSCCQSAPMCKRTHTLTGKAKSTTTGRHGRHIHTRHIHRGNTHGATRMSSCARLNAPRTSIQSG
mmetsp:Transcript_64482/g.108038  ORF Transcript_64482/g.108038 Transcript_64482/m.108038 type:complete len:258 (+) Transcript_64482:39-812(+)